MANLMLSSYHAPPTLSSDFRKKIRTILKIFFTILPAPTHFSFFIEAGKTLFLPFLQDDFHPAPLFLTGDDDLLIDPLAQGVHV